MNGSNCTCSALEVLPLLADEDIVSTSSCLSSLRRSQPKFHHENDTHGSLRNHRRLLIVDLQFAVSYVCETCPKPLKIVRISFIYLPSSNHYNLALISGPAICARCFFCFISPCSKGVGPMIAEIFLPKYSTSTTSPSWIPAGK